MAFSIFLKNLVSALTFNRLYYHGNTANKSIYLTFDDGVHEKNTPEILALLNKKNIKASFFVQGCNLESENQQSILKALADSGHSICNHAYSHRKYGEIPLKEYLNEVDATESAIKKITGVSNKFFRPPYGQLTLPTLTTLLLKGYKVVMWSYDPEDSFISNPKQLLDSLKSKALTDGDIILFHDDYDHSLQILESIISHWQALGYRFCKLG